MVGVYKKEYIVCIISRVQSTEEEAREETSWIHRRAPEGIARLSHSTSTLNTKIESTSSSSSFHGSAQYASKILSINFQEGMKEYLGIRSYGLELWNFHSPKNIFLLSAPLLCSSSRVEQLVSVEFSGHSHSVCESLRIIKGGCLFWTILLSGTHPKIPRGYENVSEYGKKLIMIFWLWEKNDVDLTMLKEEQGLLLAEVFR